MLYAMSKLQYDSCRFSRHERTLNFLVSIFTKFCNFFYCDDVMDWKGNRGSMKRAARPKKRSYHFNVASRSMPKSSASERKLKNVVRNETVQDREFGYRLINFIAVFSAVSDYVTCKDCNGKVTFSESSVRGLSFKIVVSCGSCDDKTISSCPLIRGHAYEINHRIIFAMRMLGIGLSGLRKFCGLMDLPKPIAQCGYDRIVKYIRNAAKNVAQGSMFRAANEEMQCTQGSAEEEPEGITVSGDGTWRKRGFSSLYGVVNIIGHLTGKVIDVYVKSAYCKICEIWEKKVGTDEYVQWLDEHMDNCKANHEGSAGKMEIDGALEIFRRSETLYGLKYLNYIGDGDCKTYKAIVDSFPYVCKKECCGHVQKRMGTRLRNLKNTVKGISGKGKLTGKLIDELASYYGNAIRENSDSVEKMKRAIFATYFHKCSSDLEPLHDNCPSGESSWCSWQRSKANGSLKDYKHKQTLHPDVKKAILPIYTALTDEELLKRCIGGYTQNNNESLNSTIWKIAPKTSFDGVEITEIATYIALSVFNDGYQSILKILVELELTIGSRANDLCVQQDERRLTAAANRALLETKEARQIRRKQEIEKKDADLLAEGALYGPGIAP